MTRYNFLLFYERFNVQPFEILLLMKKSFTIDEIGIFSKKEGLKMSINPIAAEKIQYGAKALVELVDPLVRQEGLEDFLRGSVKDIHYHDEIYIEAIVHGESPYQVLIDLDFPANSLCPCPQEGCCRHMLAAVFTAYSWFDRPQDLLNQVSTSNAPRSSHSLLPEGTLLEEDAPSQWSEIFELTHDKMFSRYRGNLIPAYQLFFERMTKPQINWSLIGQKVYQVYLILFCLNKLEQQQLCSSFPPPLGIQEVNQTFCGRLHEILNQTMDSETHGLPEKHQQLLIDILVKSAFTYESPIIDWLTVYRQVWWYLLNNQAAVQEEKSRLKVTLQNAELPLSQERNLRFALAHLHVMAKDDLQAQAYFEPYIKEQLQDSFFYLTYFESTDQWERLEDWLYWLRPYLQNAQKEDIEFVCHLWAKIAETHLSSEEWADVLISLLPGSFPFYTEFLLQKGRYRQWVDFCLANSITPVEIAKEHLKQIEKEDLPSLLVLYHRGVDHFIHGKSRSDYKNAVDLLKKIRALYKKLKQQDRWDMFITRLTTKYHRLRAFQEELMKGKLNS